MDPDIRLGTARIRGVHYLRGFAAMAVVLCHFGSGMVGYPQLSALLNNGQMGVHVFFFISGFVILYSLETKNYRPAHFFRFLLKRSLRIDPPYVVVILLTLLVFRGLAQLPSFHGKAIPFIPGQFLAHVFYFVPFTRWEFYNSVFWTLFVEFQFYVLVGALYFLSSGKAYRTVFLAVFALVSLMDLPGRPFLLLHYSCLFSFGMSFVGYFTTRRLSQLLLPLGCLAVCVAVFDAGIGICLAVSALAVITFRGDYPVPAYLGKVSYSLYLIHPLAGMLTAGVLRRAAPHLDPLVVLVACVAAALLAATALYYAVERPALRWSKHPSFGRRL